MLSGHVTSGQHMSGPRQPQGRWARGAAERLLRPSAPISIRVAPGTALSRAFPGKPARVCVSVGSWFGVGAP